jgi:DNA-directed RNA polymerase subunit M/transcription elongation factor TFIIS
MGALLLDLGALKENAFRAETQGMKSQLADRCPACGSRDLLLQGRIKDDEPTRDMVCMECLHTWPEPGALVSSTR